MPKPHHRFWLLHSYGEKKDVRKEQVPGQSPFELRLWYSGKRL